MGRSRSKSPARSRPSKHKSSSYRSQRNRSVGRDSKSGRERRRSRSKSPSKYSRRYSSRSRSRSLSKYGSSSKSSGSSKYQSSRRRRRSSSYTSSSESSYSSDSSRSHKSNRDRKLTKKVEQMNIAVEQPPAPPQIVFESVNMLHDDKDQKGELDDLDNEGFVQKSFTSNKKPDDPKVEAQPVPKVKEAPPVDTLLHHELFGDDEARLDKWIKKLFNYRQKISQGEA